MRKHTLMLVLLLGAAGPAFLAGNLPPLPSPGCGTEGCHRLQPGIAEFNDSGNLRLTIRPDARLAPRTLAAELINADNKIVDFRQAEGNAALQLHAPKPGRYRVHVALAATEALWDSTTVTIAPSRISIPSAGYDGYPFRLYPPHPLRIRSTCLLRFLLPQEGKAELSLFTPNGHRVTSIFSGEMAAGMHTLQWEPLDALGRPLPGGNYLVELHAAGKTLVQQVIVAQTLSSRSR